MLPLVAAAVLYVWVYFANSVSVISPFFRQPLQMQSFSSANQMCQVCYLTGVSLQGFCV